MARYIIITEDGSIHKASSLTDEDKEQVYIGTLSIIDIGEEKQLHWEPKEDGENWVEIPTWLTGEEQQKARDTKDL